MIEIKSRYTGAVLYTSATATEVSVTLMEGLKSGAYLSGANLSGANLSGAYLSSANLSDANLSDANLSGANLSGANLSGADLSGAYLSGANLSGADLSGAYLSSAYLSGAYLSGADLSGANLSGADLRSADLRSAKTIREIKCNGKMIQIQNVAEWGPMIAYIDTLGTLYVWIGCQHKTAKEMVAHWKGREDRPMSRVALKMAQTWYKAVCESK